MSAAEKLPHHFGCFYSKISVLTWGKKAAEKGMDDLACAGWLVQWRDRTLRDLLLVHLLLSLLDAHHTLNWNIGVAALSLNETTEAEVASREEQKHRMVKKAAEKHDTNKLVDVLTHVCALRVTADLGRPLGDANSMGDA